jgi:hypothetical protein
MFSVSKIKVLGDVIVYDGDQIAFLVRSNQVELSLTNEDLANGEVPASKRKEILRNKLVIEEEIKRLGFAIIEE